MWKGCLQCKPFFPLCQGVSASSPSHLNLLHSPVPLLGPHVSSLSSEKKTSLVPQPPACFLGTHFLSLPLFVAVCMCLAWVRVLVLLALPMLGARSAVKKRIGDHLCSRQLGTQPACLTHIDHLLLAAEQACPPYQVQSNTISVCRGFASAIMRFACFTVFKLKFALQLLIPNRPHVGS